MSIMYDHVVAILTTRFGVAPEEVRPEATLADLDLDSLALVEFALTVQSELGVALGDDEAAPHDKLIDVVTLLESKGARV
jgi:acyl carrier protein